MLTFFFLNFTGNVISMQFSPIKLPQVHDRESIKRLHTYSHIKIIGGCVQTSKMLDHNIISSPEPKAHR